MKYTLLYEIDLGPIPFHLLIIPIVLILVGVIGARFIKKYGFRLSFPLGIPKPYSQGFMNNYARFFSIMIAFFGFIVMIVLLVKIPLSIIEKKEIKDAMENGHVNMIEGQISHFSPPDDINRDSESFMINGIIFGYSDYEDTYGYHKTSAQNGVIKGNGQLMRITYY